MKDRILQSVLEAQDRDDYRRIAVRIARQLGFDTITTMIVIDRRGADTEFHGGRNAPEAYLNYAAGRIDKWETQAAFGYRTGICLALHMPEGLHFVLGVDRDQALPRDRAEVGRILSALQLFAVYAQDSRDARVAASSREPAATSAQCAGNRLRAMHHGGQDTLGGRRDPSHRGVIRGGTAPQRRA